MIVGEMIVGQMIFGGDPDPKKSDAAVIVFYILEYACKY